MPHTAHPAQVTTLFASQHCLLYKSCSIVGFAKVSSPSLFRHDFDFALESCLQQLPNSRRLIQDAAHRAPCPPSPESLNPFGFTSFFLLCESGCHMSNSVALIRSQSSEYGTQKTVKANFGIGDPKTILQLIQVVPSSHRSGCPIPHTLPRTPRNYKIV